MIEALVSRRTRLAESPVAALTPCELDVLREMAQGKSNSGIGEALFLSASAMRSTSTRSSASSGSPPSRRSTGASQRS